MEGNNNSFVNNDLDERMPDYVRAEMAGDDVALAYPMMHEYVTNSEHARQLHEYLLETEKLAMMGLFPEIKRQIPPDLSFLSETE